MQSKTCQWVFRIKQWRTWISLAIVCVLALNFHITTLPMSLEHGLVHMEYIFEPISIFNTFSNFFFMSQETAISLLTTFFAEQKKKNETKSKR